MKTAPPQEDAPLPVKFLSEECRLDDLTPGEVDAFSAWWLAMAQEIEDAEGEHLPWPGRGE